VLNAERFEEASRPVTETARTCSANFVIGAAGGRVVDIESSPDHVSRLHAQDGIVTHSNHFLAEGHGESLLEKISPNTLYRADRMRALLHPHRGALSFERMRAAAMDHFGEPFAICRHPDPSQPSEKRTMTVGAVLIDLEARTMHVADGPPCVNDYMAFGI
jgi:isopenicillin-N N-acyltransferase-like protein